MNPKLKSDRLVSSLGTWLVDRINIFFRIRHYIKMVAQRWILLAISTVISLGCAIYMAVKQPDIYAARSQITVAPRVVTSGSTPRPQFQEEVNSYYDVQLSLINSSKVTSRVEDKMKETPLPPGGWASMKVQKAPASFYLIMESTDLEYAKKWVTIWAREFLNFKEEIKDSTLGNKANTVMQEVAANERALLKARTALAEFQKTNEIASPNDVVNSALAIYERHNAQLNEIITERSLLEKRTPEEIANQGGLDLRIKGGEKPEIQNKESKESKDSTEGATKFESGSLYADLVRNRKIYLYESNELSGVLRPNHPYMVDLDRKIREMDKKLKIQLEMTATQLKEKIDYLKIQEETLTPIVEDFKQKLVRSSQIKILYDRLNVDVEELSRTVLSLKKEQQSLDLVGLDEANFTISQEGQGSTTPIRPNRPQMILMGLLIGLLTGLGIIFLLSRLDDRLELAEDIEAELEQPVLGQIPQLDMHKLQLDHVLITKLEEHNMFSEAIRGVRSAVMLGSNGSKKQILLVSSAVPGDGKTTFTVNFAVTLAIAGYRVLLIDSDLRRGNVHSYFGEPREPGFSEMLLGELHWSDVLEATEVKTLDVIFSGKLPNNPGELLISPVTRQFLDEAKQSYDYIIFDCPPLTAIDDTFSLVGLADGLLFVVRSGQTSMRFAKNAINSVKQRGANLLGLVLNGITADNPNYYYQNYYHNYYSAEQKSGSVKNAPLPAVKMAAPKNARPQFASIDAQAKALAGQAVSPEALAASERLKAERFRARAAAAGKDKTS